MQYRDFGKTGVKVSALGFGCMRFPTVCKDGAERIDEPQAAAMLRRAIDRGVNYIDTAWLYHNGESEECVGRALRDGYRDKVYIATKSPVFSLKREDDFERILEKQLEKLQTDHIDFYLLHALGREKWDSVVLPFRLLDKMRAAKADGRVGHIGFSFHDTCEQFIHMLDAFEGCEFVQIQYNYLDLTTQAGTRGLLYAASKGQGVVVMEPLLGGKLASPPPQVRKILPDSRTPVEWALDFLWSMPEIGPVLSGMSTMGQTEENLLYADRSHPGMLAGNEIQTLREARRIFAEMPFVPCTRCAYCMPCPFGLDIPGLYECYNKTALISPAEAVKSYDAQPVGADACRQCRKCEQICPQHISPQEFMPQVTEHFAQIRDKLAAKAGA